MSIRSWVVTVLGGAVVAAFARYPLMEIGPLSFVQGWPVPSERSITLLGLNVILMLLIVATAARWAGTQNRLQAAVAGALSGVVVGTLVCALDLCPMGGVMGAARLFEVAYQTPAQPFAQALLADAVFTVTAWTYGLEWAVIALAGLLGGLVGASVGPLPEAHCTHLSHFTVRVFLMVGILVACLSLVSAIVMYTRMWDAVLGSNPASQSPAPTAAFTLTAYLAVGTNLAVLWLGLVGMLYASRSVSASEPGEAASAALTLYLSGAFALLTLIPLIGLSVSFVARALVWPGSLIVAVLGVLLIQQGYRQSRRARNQPRWPARLPSLEETAGTTLAASLLLVVLVHLLLLANVLNLDIFVVALSQALVSVDASTGTGVTEVVAHIVRRGFSMPFTVLLTTWALLSVVFLSSGVIVRAVLVSRERRHTERASSTLPAAGRRS